MAPADSSGRRQFDVACGVLSRCVTAGKTMAAAPAAAAAPTTTAPPTTMLLMPGADVAPDVSEDPPAEAATAVPQLAQLTITYGDRVAVFDDFPSHRVAELLLVAERRARPADLSGAGGAADDIPAVARKASLQRFMEKRRDRLVARAPYAVAARPAPAAASSSSKEERRDRLGGEQDSAGSSSWLGLGVPGGCA